MSAASLEHPSDEVLEMYALYQLAAESSDTIEEHLLVCQPCQDRFVELEHYIGAMKEACRAASAPTRGLQRQTSYFSLLKRVPTVVWAGSILSVAMLAALPFPHHNPAAEPVREIHLSAMRGAQGAESAITNIRLLIDTAELTSCPTYRVAVVGPTGKPLWWTELPAATQLSVRLPIHLEPGAYWIRIYGNTGDLLREFSLNMT